MSDGVVTFSSDLLGGTGKSLDQRVEDFVALLQEIEDEYLEIGKAVAGDFERVATQTYNDVQKPKLTATKNFLMDFATELKQHTRKGEQTAMDTVDRMNNVNKTN